MSRVDPLILVPGLGCDERLFAHQRAHLREVADPIVVHVPDTHDIGLMAQGILDIAPTRFALAGLSMGGYIALEIVEQAPERVTKLALLDTKSGLDVPAVHAARLEAIDQIRHGQFAAHIEARLPLLLGPAAFTDARLCAVTREMAQSVGAERYARQQQAIMGRRDMTSSLTDIQCPTLVLCGRDDALTPEAEHTAMAQAIPGARLALIEHCGHLSTLEQPVAVTALLRDWLLYDR